MSDVHLPSSRRGGMVYLRGTAAQALDAFPGQTLSDRVLAAVAQAEGGCRCQPQPPRCLSRNWLIGFRGQRCGLDAGHDGVHVYFGDNFTIGWGDRPTPSTQQVGHHRPDRLDGPHHAGIPED